MSSTTRTHAPSRGCSFIFRLRALLLHRLRCPLGATIPSEERDRRGTDLLQLSHRPPWCPHSPFAKLGKVSCSCRFILYQSVELFWKRTSQYVFASTPLLLMPRQLFLPTEPSAFPQPFPTSPISNTYHRPKFKKIVFFSFQKQVTL